MAQKDNTSKITVLRNKKVILGSLALVMGFAVILLFSFIPYTIKPENIKSLEFLTDLLIVCAIVILAMVSTIFIGQASNAQNPKSKIAKSTVKFLESKDQVIAKGIHTFKQWVTQVQQPKDIQTIKERILASAGVEDYTVLDLNNAEIRTLLDTPQIINNVPYPALTQKQIDTVISIKEKGIKLDMIPPEYYLNVKNILDKRTPSERASAEGAKKALTLITSVGSKLITTVIISIIFAIFVKDIASDSDIAEAFAKLVSRLMSFFTSVFMGYLVGCQINDIDSEYIDMRIEIHLEFLEDKEFISLDIKEKAKAQVIERLKQEQYLLTNTEQ